jgi:hypothetical protein
MENALAIGGPSIHSLCIHFYDTQTLLRARSKDAVDACHFLLLLQSHVPCLQRSFQFLLPSIADGISCCRDTCSFGIATRSWDGGGKAPVHASFSSDLCRQPSIISTNNVQKHSGTSLNTQYFYQPREALEL